MINAVQQDPVDAALARSCELIGIGREREAVQLLLKALGNNPDDDRLHIQISEAYLALNQPKEAFLHAELSTKACPTREEGYLLRSRIFQKEGQKRNALIEAENAWRVAPQSIWVMLRLFNALMSLGRYGDARKIALMSRSRMPDSTTVHEMFGRLALVEKKADQAEQHFRRLLAIEPDAIHAQINLAIALMKLGRNREAFDLLLGALRNAPSDHGAKHHLVTSIKRLRTEGMAQYWIWLNILPPVLKLMNSLIGLSDLVALFVGAVVIISGMVVVACFRKKFINQFPQAIRDFTAKENKERRQANALNPDWSVLMGPILCVVPLIFWFYLFPIEGKLHGTLLDIIAGYIIYGAFAALVISITIFGGRVYYRRQF